MNVPSSAEVSFSRALSVSRDDSLFFTSSTRTSISLRRASGTGTAYSSSTRYTSSYGAITDGMSSRLLCVSLWSSNLSCFSNLASYHVFFSPSSFLVHFPSASLAHTLSPCPSLSLPLSFSLSALALSTLEQPTVGTYTISLNITESRNMGAAPRMLPVSWVPPCIWQGSGRLW